MSVWCGVGEKLFALDWLFFEHSSSNETNNKHLKPVLRN